MYHAALIILYIIGLSAILYVLYGSISGFLWPRIRAQLEP